MRLSKIIGALALTCLAIAVVATAASAAKLELTGGATYPQNFTSSSKNISRFTTTSNGHEWLCASLEDKGILNSATDALILFLWHKCEATVSGVTVACTTSGEPTGLIHFATLALPVFVVLSSGLISPGFLIEKENGATLLAKFVCGGLVTIEVKGTVIANVTNPNMAGEKAHLMTANAETSGTGTSSKQTFTKTDEEPSVTMELESNENGGAFAKATIEFTEDDIIFEKGGVEAEFK